MQLQEHLDEIFNASGPNVDFLVWRNSGTYQLRILGRFGDRVMGYELTELDRERARPDGDYLQWEAVEIARRLALFRANNSLVAAQEHQGTGLLIDEAEMRRIREYLNGPGTLDPLERRLAKKICGALGLPPVRACADEDLDTSEWDPLFSG